MHSGEGETPDSPTAAFPKVPIMTIQGVAGAVCAAQQCQIQNAIATAVMGEQLEVMEELGEAAVELIEVALEFAKSEEVGTIFDATA